MKVTRKKLLIFFSALASIILITFLIIICWLVVVFHQFLPLVPYLPKLLGMNTPQTYLILFQNNMELRPGGGFIGSYGVVTLNKGKPGNFSVHNTYDADGLLHKHIEPYYIGRRFIQVHLYMRDSNFDVDFAKSAEKVAYMYHLETGDHVDGVVGVDLSYIQSIVGLLSPLYIWQYNQTVTPNNFFMLTEEHADRHSFYGSTQKQDFLRSLADNMSAKIHANKISSYIGILQKTLAAISEKHLLFASEDNSIQSILSKNNLSSTLYDPRPNAPNVINDFLGINEANIGVNKSNYFLRRTIDHHVSIQDSGTVQENLAITYTNTSPKEEWPTGRYIAYVRIIVPHGSTLSSISFDGKKQNIVPAITDYHVYEAKGFTPPQGLEVDHMEEEGKTLYGFRILVSYHTTLVVHVAYQLPMKVTTNNPTYDLVLFKQPGMNNDPLTFSLSYPTYYKHVSSSISPTDTSIPYMYVLKTTFLTDKHITIHLQN